MSDIDVNHVVAAVTNVLTTMLSVTSASVNPMMYVRPLKDLPRNAVRFVITSEQLLGNEALADVPDIGRPTDV